MTAGTLPLQHRYPSGATAMQHHDQIEAALLRVLGSRPFRRSGRLSRFLRFVVSETLDGRASDLKEFTIRVEVFDKPQTFDPRTDPIVRVEARRLRKKLLQFYATEGRQETLRFEIPVGGYAPVMGGVTSGPPVEPVRRSPGGIAVLPFVNLTGEANNDYFSDGLTEELIVALTKVEGLRVVAWNSSSRLRGEDLAEAGRKLGVTSLLTGSARRSGESLRITAQLVSAEDGRFLWSENFDRDARQIFVVQEEIAAAIARTLRMTLGQGRRFTHSIDAYHEFLRGRFLWNMRKADSIRRAIDFFDRAIVLDPGFPEPHAGIADSWIVLAKLGIEPARLAMPTARDFAQRALALDASNADAHVSLGSVEGLFAWNWPAAERHYLEALRLRPQYATAHHWYAYDYLMPLNRLEEAAQEMAIALEIDPLSPILHASLGFLEWLRGRYAKSIEAYERGLDMEFAHRVRLGLARSLHALGRHEEALEELHRARSESPWTPENIAALAHGYALAGQPDEAARQAALLDEPHMERCATPYARARAHLRWNNEAALKFLAATVEARDPRAAHLRVAHTFRDLHGDPRFEALLRQIGI